MKKFILIIQSLFGIVTDWELIHYFGILDEDKNILEYRIYYSKSKNEYKLKYCCDTGSDYIAAAHPLYTESVQLLLSLRSASVKSNTN